MKIPQDAQMLRIFISEGDKYENQPLYEAIVHTARNFGLSGATVFRGIIGFDAHEEIHTSKILMLSEDLPLVVEIVDIPEKIEAFLPVLDEMIDEGLVTLEKVRIITYRHTSDDTVN